MGEANARDECDTRGTYRSRRSRRGIGAGRRTLSLGSAHKACSPLFIANSGGTRRARWRQAGAAHPASRAGENDGIAPHDNQDFERSRRRADAALGRRCAQNSDAPATSPQPPGIVRHRRPGAAAELHLQGTVTRPAERRQPIQPAAAAQPSAAAPADSASSSTLAQRQIEHLSRVIIRLACQRPRVAAPPVVPTASPVGALAT